MKTNENSKIRTHHTNHRPSRRGYERYLRSRGAERREHIPTAEEYFFRTATLPAAEYDSHGDPVDVVTIIERSLEAYG